MAAGDDGGCEIVGGDKRAVDAGATRDRTASRGDAQSRPSQSSADIRAITLSTVLKISRCVLVSRSLAHAVIDNARRDRAAVDRRRVAIDARDERNAKGEEKKEKKIESERQPGREKFPGTRRARTETNPGEFEFDRSRRMSGGTEGSA